MMNNSSNWMESRRNLGPMNTIENLSKVYDFTLAEVSKYINVDSDRLRYEQNAKAVSGRSMVYYVMACNGVAVRRIAKVSGRPSNIGHISMVVREVAKTIEENPLAKNDKVFLNKLILKVKKFIEKKKSEISDPRSKMLLGKIYED